MNLVVVILKIKIFQKKNYKKNYINQLLKNPRKEKYNRFFIDNIWDVALAHMPLISKFNNEIRFFLCVIDVFSKYAWVIITLKHNVLNSKLLIM